MHDGIRFVSTDEHRHRQCNIIHTTATAGNTSGSSFAVLTAAITLIIHLLNTYSPNQIYILYYEPQYKTRDFAVIKSLTLRFPSVIASILHTHTHLHRQRHIPNITCAVVRCAHVGREKSPFARDDDRVQLHCYTHARKARINDDIFTLKNTYIETNNPNNFNMYIRSRDSIKTGPKKSSIAQL